MRLKYRISWFRYYFPFIWAHKPLCEKFNQDVLNIAGIYLCRSCLCICAGFIFSLFLYICGNFKIINLSFYYLTLFSVIALSYPPLYKKFPRLIRDIIRLAGGGILGFIIVLLLKEKIITAVATIFIVILFNRIQNARRSDIKKNICDDCSEFAENKTCSGFKKQADRIKSFDNELNEKLIHS